MARSTKPLPSFLQKRREKTAPVVQPVVPDYPLRSEEPSLVKETATSVKSALHKFNAQRAFFAQSQHFDSYNAFVNALPSLPDDVFCCVIDNVHIVHTIDLSGIFLCEVLAYDDDLFHMTCITRKDATCSLVLPSQYISRKVNGVSLSLIATDDEPYRSYLQKSVQHYAKMLQSMLPYEINVAFYGTRKPSLPSSVHIESYDGPFHMAQARNRSLDMSRYNTTLIMDLDCYLTKEHIKLLITTLCEKNTQGLLALKNTYTSGNGLAYGLTECFAKNTYDERFQHFFFEDTHWLMNFSRKGIVPVVSFLNFPQENHSREKTLQYSRVNHDLFFTLMQHG